MPKKRFNGADLYYEEHGSGSETVVFGHGLLFSGRMFDAQISALKDRYRCVTFDFRGQGQSAVTRDGYDIDTLTEDAAAVIKSLGAAPCHYVGLSMGGFAGLRLAIRKPDLLRSLTLIDSSAEREEATNVLKYRLLGLIGRWLGIRLVINRVTPIMFGKRFMDDPARFEERARWQEVILSNDRVGLHRTLREVIKRPSIYDDLYKIQLPTLIVVGEEDAATQPVHSERMHARIPDSRLVVIPDAGHTSTVESPEMVNAALKDFFSQL